MTAKKTTATSAKKPVGLKIERTFRASPEEIWALWTTKEGVESWWGPEGFTTKVLALDLRPGGAFDYEMTARAPEQVEALKSLGVPRTSRATNVYTEVTAPRRLALRTKVDFVPGVAPYEFATEVEFRKVQGGTKLVFRSSKMHSLDWEQMARQGQMSQLDKLARLVEGRSTAGPDSVGLALPSEREVVVTRVFRARPERVFEAHVDRKALEAWWGPRDYQTKVERWDPRPGGAWRIVQRSPDGTNHGFHGEFLEVVPHDRLAWTFEYEGTPGHVVTQTTTFSEQRGGATLITVRAVYASKKDRDAMLASGMEWGMRQSYERLDEHLRN